ncbi:MAG: hypothetical protein WBE21_15845, partial [Candidatus Acidiferrales bacterium]
MRAGKRLAVLTGLVMVCFSCVAFARNSGDDGNTKPASSADRTITSNARDMVKNGRQIFRFDTFGDESFWGDTLHLDKALEGAKLGGVGPGVSPRTALAVGLKVDVDALPASLVLALQSNKVNLDDPA